MDNPISKSENTHYQAFTIKAVGTRERLGDYRYEIYHGAALVARYWHDFRGDDHGIEFTDGTGESWPVGRTIDYFKDRLTLSDAAVNYLHAKISAK